MTARSLGSLATVGVCFAAFSTPDAGRAQTIRVGAELQVNVYTVGYQWSPAVAMNGGGNFVIAWSSYDHQDGSYSGVFARRFNAAGEGLATEFQVNLRTAFDQASPAVGINDDGDFVIAWGSEGGTGGVEIVARRFDSAGAGNGNEFQVNSYTTSTQFGAAVGVDGDGDFVIAWQSTNQDGSSGGVFARRFDSAGTAMATELQVNAYTSGSQGPPAVGINESGAFVVVWDSAGQDGSSTGVFARRFDSAGDGLGAELQVNLVTADFQRQSAVAMHADGSFVVVWDDFDVLARLFDSAGVGLGAEIAVNSYPESTQTAASVGFAGDGDFVIAWQSATQDGSDFGVFGRRFDAAGGALGAEFQVNTRTSGLEEAAVLGIDDDGDFVLAWVSQGQDGSNLGVFAQRFASLAVLDIDGDGETLPLTDGILVLRYLFGFSGATLVTGAIDIVDCTRCDSAAITTALQSLNLDIDGNGAAGALTDGLLALRYLFGFVGATLVSGVVDLVGCSRCDATAIEPHLKTLK